MLHYGFGIAGAFLQSSAENVGNNVNVAKHAIATMVAALPEITIKDEENEFDSKEFKEEYEKTYRDAVEYTTPIIKALNGLPVYYRYHIKNGLALGKGLKIVRHQDFTNKRNQSQKRKEKKRNEGRVNKKLHVEDVEKVDDVEKFVMRIYSLNVCVLMTFNRFTFLYCNEFFSSNLAPILLTELFEGLKPLVL
jgi:hypothetical protein